MDEKKMDKDLMYINIPQLQNFVTGRTENKPRTLFITFAKICLFYDNRF